MKLFKPKPSTILYPLSLLLSLFAAGAARGETVGCSSWAEVKTALTSGKSAKLSADITANSAIDLTGGDVTLDLNGHKVTYGASSYLVKMTGTTFTIDDSGTGGTIDGTNVWCSINGYFQVEADSVCVFRKGTIKGFQASSGGVFFVAENGSFDFQGGTIQSCDAHYGGAICVDGYLSMSGGTIASCWVDKNGGAILVGETGSAEINGGEIASCMVSRSDKGGVGGGGIFVEGSCSISGGTIKGCNVPNGGGAAYISGTGQLEISGGTITNCWATKEGGGIYGESGSVIELSGGTIAKCSAQYGGGLKAFGSITVSGGVISDCTATDTGGGIESGGTLLITGGTITGCVANNYYGGGVYTYGTSTVSGGAFKNCSAFRTGGAICLASATKPLNVSGGLFLDNVCWYDSNYANFGERKATVSGGVFNNWSGMDATLASGSVAVKGNSCTFVGKNVVTYGDKILQGTYTFDPQGEPYADLQLIITAITTVTKSDDTWVVATEAPDHLFECATWSELSSILSHGLNAKLTCDITQDTSNACVIEDYYVDLTLDLNGCTLTRQSGVQLISMNCANATLTVTGEGTIDGTVDTLSSNGGCFSVTAGTLVLESGTLKGKAANGGAVAVTGSSAKFEMTGGTITGSSASASGGGVYISSSGQFELKGGEISGCSASSSYGGGVFAYGGKFIMRGGTLESNTASGSYGGGAAARSGGTIEVYDGTFRGNTACNGGAIEGWSSSSVTIKGGLFVDNLSTWGSKEHNLYCDGNLSVSGGVFNNGLESDVIAYPSGYGQKSGPTYTFVGKDLVLDGDQIESGTLTYDPQGETFRGHCIVDTDISTVTQSGDAWVVYTANPTTYVECSDWASLKEHLVAGDSVKLMNDITQDSDAAYLYCGWSQTLNLNGHTLKRVNSNNWLIVPRAAGNVLTVKGGGTIDGTSQFLGADGGCLHVIAGKLILLGGTFKGKSSYNGGAIAIDSGAACEMRGGTITESKAYQNGGGVYVAEGGTFTMTGGTIENCTAKSASSDTCYEGGGVYSCGTTTLSDCTISGNHADNGGNGGGIFARAGTLSMTRVTVANNESYNAAGGVGVSGTALTLDDCTISGNTAKNDGGGLYIEGVTVEMSSGTISENMVDNSTTDWERCGGGVKLAKSANTRFILSGGTIKNNSAPNGGGVGVRNLSSFQMTGGTISGNIATKAWGGGIGVEFGGEAIVTGGEIAGNTANGESKGGGVCASGTFQMSYCVVKDNDATNGGALYLNTTNSHSVSGGVVLGSVCVEGSTPLDGGIYDTDVSAAVNAGAGWKQFDCNGMKVIAQNNVTAGNQFSTKDNEIYTGVFNFNVSDSLYAEYGVSLEPSRFITQMSDGLWYVTAPPSIYVNGAPINDGSGTGWRLANGIVTLLSAMDYKITGTSQGTDIGLKVAANATVELSSLTLTLGSQASVAPFHFTSGASAAKLNLTGDNTVYALGGHSAVEIDSGASVTLEGDGSLIGSGETSGNRGIYVAGTLKMMDGLITLYNTTQDGGAVAVADGGTFDWTGGDITLCTGGNGGVLCNAGTATITNAVLTGNAASGGGGAIYSSGTLTVGNSRFESNEASGNGGAISIAGGTATVLSSSFRKNQADGSGGAISCAGNLTMLNSTLIQCKAKSTDAGGGGVYFEGGSSKLANVTIRANSSAGYGGGIYAYGGSLSFVNVLLQGNTASVSSSSGDFCEDGAAVQAWGVLAEKTNLSGGEGCCFNESGCGWTSLFTTGPGESKYTVGETWQYVEELYRTTSNKALNGYDGSEYRTDITGRSFDACQIGSYWTVVDKASLTVDSLDDVADDSDGFITLRDILEGLVGGDESYTSLAEGGVYKITFRPDLAGTLKMKMRQYEIANADGTVVEIDGSTAAGGRLALQGYSKLTTNKTTKAVTTNSFRAFTVWQGNTLKIKNIDFTDNVGQKVSAVGTETNDGGAIANRGTLEAEGCTFTRCAAGPSFASPSGFGGAIANGQGVKGATATMSRCTFTACRAAQGGAVYNFTSNSVVFTDCAFVSNRAGDGKSSVYGANGGAIRNASGGELSYEGTTFTDNTAVIDGVDKPSDINDEVLNTPAVAVSVAKGVMSVALCAKAAPSLTAVAAGEAAAAEEPVIDMSGEATMTDESGATVPAVAITPTNVQPYLYYGLGRSETPDGEYKVSEWVQAGADGRLPESLKSPKTGESGFYRVETRIRK